MLLDQNLIQKSLPQKYPFCLIDRVVEFEKGKRMVAIKNVTANEWTVAASGTCTFIGGHVPGEKPGTCPPGYVPPESGDTCDQRGAVIEHPVSSLPTGEAGFTFHASPSAYPPTLLIESSAQAALLLYQLSMVKEGEHPQYVLGRIKAEFFGEAMVGDEVVFKVENARMLTQGGYADVVAEVGGTKIAEVGIIFGKR